VPAAASGGRGHDLAWLELARLAVDRAEGRAPGQHDQHLLVRVVDVEREARGAGRHLEQGRAELLGAGLAPDP
jgi:hypothetical protein